MFIKIIVFSEENGFSDQIIKIIRIPNNAFYFFFVYTIILC